MDQDLKKLAGRFLEFVHRATGLPMIVCDETGTIVHSVVRQRVGSKHAFAERIMRGEADELFVTAEDVARDPRMKEGCNVAILAKGERLGTFGIAGPVEVTRPLCRIASAVLVSWLGEQRRQAALQSAASQVLEGVRRVSTRAAEVAAEASQVSELMARASSEASSKTARTGEIIRTVQEVAQKSRILSINGSVEASRAGDQGRAFGVVAREMLGLAEDARAAANHIQTTLGEVRQTIGQLGGAIGRSAALGKTQTEALGEIQSVVNALQHAVSELARGAE